MSVSSFFLAIRFRRWGAAFPMKNPARTAGIDRPREWFRDLLWAAFPGQSEREVAVRAARALGVSQRQVQNWLRCEHDASLRYVAALLIIAGAETVLGHMGKRG